MDSLLLVMIAGKGGKAGPNPAPLSYGKEPTEQQNQFKDDTFNTAQPKNPTPGDLLAIEKIAPNADAAADAERGRAREFADTEQAATWKRSLAPRHRGIVGRYFTDPPASGEQGRTAPSPPPEKK